ncbi:ABC transporter ATP-binding protein [Kingella negevensis]|uniref:ABC transporter ATP-binding protein n=1 Tax=Kingella negevensis TaxID=1522312 RepID=UPI0025437CE3|nr:ABC transporter ATP-binding protein [Kingella negevensis]MDK4679696.1 ABC transporter ATP-binding protein [Kingella negevensis]MDK4682585.1 ABC transporter ATP-binding protein [Kingella negevensis]MDK4690782.1 ABC transporter ATP-binding protein [Kingella negevensis]MDK4694070.1 ABC transporter ATP-binding protein [Kingella negevensis]MDK4699799.1 ABC transporter ATP-binding protein [Kingella negevensis]
MIIVIHDINLTARFCGELVALHQGHLLKVGTPNEIMAADVLREIYSVDMHILQHPVSGDVMAVPQPQKLSIIYDEKNPCLFYYSRPYSPKQRHALPHQTGQSPKP